MYTIGIDIGGTFTDCVVIDGAGRLCAVSKAPTRTGAPEEGVLDALALAAQDLGLHRPALLRDCAALLHASTVATNALVERRGCAVGLLTTRGHEDALLIGRVLQKAAGLSEAQLTHQSRLDKADPPLVPRQRIVGLPERMDARGEVVAPLDPASVPAAVDALVAQGIEALAISFLWSFLRPDHERAVEEAVRARHPGLFVTASHRLAPVLGEYERTATAVLNAYVGPAVIRYLERLQERLAAEGYRQPLLVAHCLGGTTGLDEVRRRPLLTLGSGPVSGVLAARFFAAMYGERDLICADVGGTTFDVSLVVGGEPVLDEEPVAAQYHYALPRIAVESIGAGGGSVLWVDEAGLLRVGPRSAGADPGPAAYENGGTEATVTDAHLVLGYLSAEGHLSGRRPLSLPAARAALERLAAGLGGDAVQVAAGACRIVDAQMADLIRQQTVNRGHDPRRFALFAYGGGGPLHVAFIARELGIARTYVPRTATAFSALGLLTAGLVHSAEAHCAEEVPLDGPAWRRLAGAMASLRGELAGRFAEEGVQPQDVTWSCHVHLQYRLQPKPLTVLLPGGGTARPDGPAPDLRRLFLEAYRTTYGRDAGEAAVELVRCRVTGQAPLPVPRPPREPDVAGASAAAARKGERPVFFAEAGGFVPTPVYDGERLAAGAALRGPAVVERMGDTLVLPPFAAAAVDGFGNVRLTVG